MENNKSQAEIYREERKKRLAKAAEKSAKKSHKNAKVKKLATKTIAIVLIVALSLSAISGILNFFGLPQRTINVKVGEDVEFSLAEFNYYYYMIWSNYYSYSIQYEQYMGTGAGAQMLGFDYTKSPDDQVYTDSFASVTGVTVAELQKLGADEPTWADAFKYAAINNLIQIKYCAKQALAQGITLTDAQNTEINNNIESLRTTAAQDDYSLDRYLRANYGNGVSEKVVRQILEENFLATAYMEKLESEMRGKITDDVINAEYEANRVNYDVVDFKTWVFTAETESVLKEGSETEYEDKVTDATKADAKAKADAFLAGVTDANSFSALAVAEFKAEKLEEAQKKIDDAQKKVDETAKAFEEASKKVEEATDDTSKADAESNRKTAEEAWTKAKEALKAVQEDKAELEAKDDEYWKTETAKSVDYNDYYKADLTEMNEDLAEWLFKEGRLANDKEVITIDEEKGVYAVVFMINPQHKNTAPATHDVRHILVAFPTDDDGKTLEIKDEEKPTYKAKAQAILDEYLKNPTEENFAKLATEKSEDPGSVEDGGLYADLTASTNFVQEFKDWYLDESRKVGDTGIIETSYGYHIMYYAKAGEESWKAAATEAVFETEYNKYFDGIMDSRLSTVNLDSLSINWATSQQNKLITKLVALNSNNSTMYM